MFEKTKSLCWQFKGNKLDNNQNSTWLNTEKHYCSLVQPLRDKFSNFLFEQLQRSRSHITADQIFLGEANREMLAFTLFAASLLSE